MDFVYKPPGPVSRRFLLSEAFVKGLMGPIGSGKSSTCVAEAVRRITGQAVGRVTGRRRTRGVVVRNTFRELEMTTIKTWSAWLRPEIWGSVKMSSPPKHKIDLELEDGTVVDAEVYFLALDRPDDAKKLLSLDLSWAWVNEAREMPKPIIDELIGRMPRYPEKEDGGPTMPGLFMDTNAMDELHWWAIMSGLAPMPEWLSEDDKKLLGNAKGWEFFTQPPAVHKVMGPDGRLVGYTVNPNAENIENLEDGYYDRQIAGKEQSWIERQLMSKIGQSREGRPVWTGFRRDLHVMPEDAKPLAGHIMRGGVDFGLTPALLLGQYVERTLYVWAEYLAQNMGAEQFSRMVREQARRDFQDFEPRLTGDPAGEQRAQTDKKTPFMMFRKAGWTIVPAATNDFEIRRAIVQELVDGLIEGRPRLMIHPRCRMLIAAMEGGYHFGRLNVQGLAQYDDEPEKNAHSHPADALQYLGLGFGLMASFVKDREREALRDQVMGKAPRRGVLDRFRRRVRGL